MSAESWFWQAPTHPIRALPMGSVCTLNWRCWWKAGLENEQALIAATAATAGAFGLEDRGRIKPGLIADLVLVDGNPLQDIMATRAIDSVWKAGRRVSDAPVEAERSVVSVPDDHLIADFNGGDLTSGIGTGFSATTDEMMNGASVAEIHWLDDSGGAMQVTGSVRTGFPFPWSGVYLQPLEDTTSLLDLSAHSDVRFRARGREGSYTLMLFGDGVAMPFRTTFDVAEAWRDVSVPLSAFTGADLSRVTGLAWVRNDIIDNFELVLDDIKIE